MMSDDLSGLFGPAPEGIGLNSLIVQGTVLSFDPSNGGANQVDVLGTVLTNVPMGLTGAEVGYEQGDAVLLLRLGNTFMLLCKVAEVGSSQYASASQTTRTNGNSASGFTASAGQHTYATTSVAVPSWATKAAVSAWCTACVHSGIDQDVAIGVDVNGSNVDWITFWGANGHTVASHVGGDFTQTIAPGTTALTAAGWLNPSTTITSAANFLVVNIQATFYRS